MPRVKRSVHARKKRRKVLEQAKGYWGLKNSNYRYAKEQVEHSLVYAYRDRKNKKRTFRRLWIIRINAAARQNGLSYNQFIAGLQQGGDRARPQGARRPRGERSRRVRRDRRAGEGRARRPERLTASDARSSTSRREHCDGRSPLYARSLPAVRRRPARRAAIVGDDALGRRRCGCSAGCTTSCSPGARRRGTTSAPRSRRARASSCAGSCAEQGVQTNEVQRSWVLLPCFLRAARAPGAGRSTSSSSGRAPG